MPNYRRAPTADPTLLNKMISVRTADPTLLRCVNRFRQIERHIKAAQTAQVRKRWKSASAPWLRRSPVKPLNWSPINSSQETKCRNLMKSPTNETCESGFHRGGRRSATQVEVVASPDARMPDAGSMAEKTRHAPSATRTNADVITTLGGRARESLLDKPDPTG